MGDEHKPYFLIEGRGLVRLIALVVAVFAALPVLDRAARAYDGGGLKYAFGSDWYSVITTVGMLVIMMVAGSVALKGKFSIP